MGDGPDAHVLLDPARHRAIRRLPRRAGNPTLAGSHSSARQCTTDERSSATRRSRGEGQRRDCSATRTRELAGDPDACNGDQAQLRDNTVLAVDGQAEALGGASRGIEGRERRHAGRAAPLAHREAARFLRQPSESLLRPASKRRLLQSAGSTALPTPPPGGTPRRDAGIQARIPPRSR
jgi:hypothetical protein